MWGGNPSCPGRVLIDFFVSRCNVALFLLDLCFSDFLLTLQQGSVYSLVLQLNTFPGVCFFSNNQHFSVFYITFWNCFTDLVPFFLPSFVELVLYICMYIIDL